jgi:uncharacterized protein YndB with AHSA1/START domain
VPRFEEVAESDAPPEEVWKLLYDPAQFERWWGCFEAGDVPSASSHPAFPMPQVVASDRGDGRITVSCLVRDIAFEWRLAERPEGGTRIELQVTVPESYAFRDETQRQLIAFSVGRLARLAEEPAIA